MSFQVIEFIFSVFSSNGILRHVMASNVIGLFGHESLGKGTIVAVSEVKNKHTFKDLTINA